MAEVCHHIILTIKRIAIEIYIICHYCTGQPFQTTDLVPSRRTYLELDFTRGIYINEIVRAKSSKYSYFVYNIIQFTNTM